MITELTLPILDESEKENAVLYRLQNDLFDTVVLIYDEGTSNAEEYVLADMQGPFPETFAEVPDYDWIRVEDM